MIEPTVQVGIDTRTIVPDQADFPIRGYTPPGERIAEGAHDELCVKSVCLSDGNATIGIAVCDISSIDISMTNEIERIVAEQTTVYDEFIIGATHTHSGPWIPIPAFDVPGEYMPDEPLKTTVNTYLETLTESVADSLLEASQSLSPATFYHGTAINDTSAVNRRKAWPRQVRYPTGPMDPELTVLVFEPQTGPDIALFSYPCHPVCGTQFLTEFSADWPGYVYDAIRDELEQTELLYLNGAAGNINPRNRYPEFSADEGTYEWNDDPDRVYAYMEEIGSEIAETVLEAIETAKSTEGRKQAYLEVNTVDQTVPIKQSEEPEKLREFLERESNQSAWVKRLLNLTRWDVDSIPAPQTYVQIGNVGYLTFPGEAFVEYGLMAKELADVETLLLSGLTNQNVGYLPILSELENGGYEVRACSIAVDGLRQLEASTRNLVCGHTAAYRS